MKFKIKTTEYSEFRAIILYTIVYSIKQYHSIIILQYSIIVHYTVWRVDKNKAINSFKPPKKNFQRTKKKLKAFSPHHSLSFTSTFTAYKTAVELLPFWDLIKTFLLCCRRVTALLHKMMAETRRSGDMQRKKEKGPDSTQSWKILVVLTPSITPISSSKCLFSRFSLLS